MSVAICLPVVSVSAAARHAAGPTITLDFAAQSFYANGRLTGIMKRWSALHPNIKIKYINLPAPTHAFSQYFDPLNVALAGGEQIDVWQTIPPYAQQYLQNGAAANLVPLAKQDHYDLAQAFGPFVGQMGSNGQVAYLPETRAFNVLFFNKSMFQAAHLPYPNANTTWPELVQMAIKLTHGQGQDKVYGYVPSAGSPHALLNPAINAGWNWVTASGAPDFNNPLVRQDLLYYKTMMNWGAMPSLNEIMNGNLNNRVMLADKQAAMITNSWWTPVGWSSYRWDAGSIWQNGIDIPLGLTYPVNLAGLPRVQNETASWGFQVSSHSRYPLQAFEFARFLATQNADVLGVIPAASGAKLSEINHMIEVYLDQKNVLHTNIYPADFVKQYDAIYQGVKNIGSIKKVPQPGPAVVNALQNLFDQDSPPYFEGKMTLDALLSELQTQAVSVLKTVQ